MEQIERLRTPRLKQIALRHLNTQIRRRHGSDEYARLYPNRAVTLKEKLEMRELHKDGLSFRACEEVYHLIPNSGNGAQRCVRMASMIMRQRSFKRAKPAQKVAVEA